MDAFTDFLANNYIWFLIVSVIMIFALVGYLVDVKENKLGRKLREKKEERIEDKITDFSTVEQSKNTVEEKKEEVLNLNSEVTSLNNEVETIDNSFSMNEEVMNLDTDENPISFDASFENGENVVQVLDDDIK